MADLKTIGAAVLASAITAASIIGAQAFVADSEPVPSVIHEDGCALSWGVVQNEQAFALWCGGAYAGNEKTAAARIVFDGNGGVIPPKPEYSAEDKALLGIK